MEGIPEFKLDKWIQQHGPQAKIPLHSSNVGSHSLTYLQSLSPETSSSEAIIDFDMPLAHAPARGSLVLRERIAAMYSPEESGGSSSVGPENVLTMPGSVMANFLGLGGIAKRGEHVVVQYPAFSQLYDVLRFNGVEVSFWRATKGEEDGEWVWDVGVLEGLVRDGETRAVVINNPNNPTGAVLDRAVLEGIARVADRYGMVVYSDEVFRPLFHSDDEKPPSMLEIPRQKGGVTVVTGSTSKAIGLPGIRVGWIVSNDLAFLERVMVVRDYTTTSVSVVDEAIAAFALQDSVYKKLLEGSLGVCKRSLEVLEEFVGEHAGLVEWVKPKGAGTAFLRVRDGKDGGWVDDKEFAGRLLEKTGVSIVPGGYCFGEPDGRDEALKGYFRVSLGVEEKVLREGLGLLSQFLKA